MKTILMLIWVGLLVEILIMSIIKLSVVGFHLVSILAVSVHILYTMAIIIASKNQYNVIFFSAFLSRVAVMIWDLRTKHIFILPNTGQDAVAFYG